MKKTTMIIIITFVAMTELYAVVPTNEWKPEDEISVNQEKKDKKIWQNLLAVYDNLRKVASGSLEIMQRVSDYAAAADKYLWAINRTATRAQLIWHNIEEIKKVFIFGEGEKKNFFSVMKDVNGRFVRLVEHTEENIFQQSDELFESDIPLYSEAKRDMDRAREGIITSGVDEAGRLKTLVQEFPGYEQLTVYLKNKSSGDKRIYDNASTNKDSKRHVISQNEAIDGIASADLRNMQLDNEGVPIAMTIKQASESDGSLTTADMINTNVISERNRLALNIRENEFTHDAVRIGNQLLLSRLTDLDKRIEQKLSYMSFMEKFSQELIAYRNRENSGTSR